MQDLLWHGIKRRDDIEHFCGFESAMRVRLLHADFNFFHFFEWLVYKLDALLFFTQIIFVLLRGENSLVEIPLIENVQFERIFNFTTIAIDFIMLGVSRRNNDLFG